MPLDDFDFERWDDVDQIYLVIDSSGAVDVSVETWDGDLIDFGSFDPEDAEDLIWDELYWWAEENDVDIDKEVEY